MRAELSPWRRFNEIGGALYQEFGPRVQTAVIDLLLNGDSAKTLQAPAD